MKPPAKDVIAARIDPELNRKLRLIVRKRKMKLSDFVRRALERAVLSEERAIKRTVARSAID